ncbi:3887_t:CDS:2 [Entrophospora sp. SA101]|nr:3881_t:CDS:2 [Entrophospora sp. SA101]CAJ0918734.1 3887_t:CDS:2 [Entrophospora sp. SA101]
MRAFVQPALQSNTFIKSPEPLQITVWIISEGIYTSPNPLKVRLWTNIKNSFESIGWLELEFKEILTISDNEEDFMPIIGCHQDEGYRIFQCTIDTKNVQEGWYEFTVKVQALVDYHDHYWEKSQGNDDSGIKNIFIKDFDKDKDQDIRYFNRYNKRNIECWIIKKLVKFNNENGGNEKLINLGKINNFLRYFGLERLGVHWLVPTIGLKKLDKIKSSNNLLYLIVQQSTGNYLVFIPITTDDYTTSFTSDDQGNLTLRVLSTTTTSDQQDSLDVSFAIGLGPDNPYDISQICMNIIKEEFYERVSHQDVLRVLESLNSNGIKIGYLLLDDGWQQTNNEKQLKDIEADQYKFPQGLKGFIDEAKRKFPYLKYFGAWHTLWGYWDGIDPNSRISLNYKTKLINLEDHDRKINLIKPNYINQFYNDFYNYLHEQGINIVKVDSQSSFDLLLSSTTTTSKNYEYYNWWKDYQSSLRLNTCKYFNNRLIYCMANNSDSWHIYTNTMNNIWTSLFDWIPDWDMFQSASVLGSYHAAARSISNCPIYITDYQNSHDISILKKCIIKSPSLSIRPSPSSFSSSTTSVTESRNLPDKILRSKLPALPSLVNLFVNPKEINRLLRIINFNGNNIGVVGFWNCRDVRVLDTFCLNEIFTIKNNFRNNSDYNNVKCCNNINCNGYNCCNCLEYALYSHNNNHSIKSSSPIRLLDNSKFNKQIPIILNPKSFDILTISPIKKIKLPITSSSQLTVRMTSFGLIDKYNGSKALIKLENSCFISSNLESNPLLPNYNFKYKNNDVRVIYNCELMFGIGICGIYLNIIEEEIGTGVGRSGKKEIGAKMIKAHIGNQLIKSENINYDFEQNLILVNISNDELNKFLTNIYGNNYEDSEGDDDVKAKSWNSNNIKKDFIELFIEVLIQE